MFLLPAKIELKNTLKTKKDWTCYLNLKQINNLLHLADIETESGLRDRSILEILISTGIKVKKLVNLNRDQIKINYKGLYFPQNTIIWIEKYLNTRKDRDKALFINYRSRKNANRRLTPRSVERITNYYGKLLNLSFPLTPETLRWARASALLKEESIPKPIKKPCTHLSYLIKKYLYQKIKNKNIDLNEDLSWHFVEKIINDEISWLKKNISVLPRGYKNYLSPPFLDCDNCILRKIAILIVNDTVKAIEFKLKGNESMWSLNSSEKRTHLKQKSYHGKEWHRRMMDAIHQYFKEQNYKVVLEPSLNYGRADLGVYVDRKQILYIEVGTISLYKLWFNLSTMRDVTFLIVPSEETIIELKV
jgi:hypothetical protein